MTRLEQHGLTPATQQSSPGHHARAEADRGATARTGARAVSTSMPDHPPRSHPRTDRESITPARRGDRRRASEARPVASELAQSSSLGGALPLGPPNSSHEMKPARRKPKGER
eukprot:6013776-Prymnesium_polylepis.1